MFHSVPGSRTTSGPRQLAVGIFGRSVSKRTEQGHFLALRYKCLSHLYRDDASNTVAKEDNTDRAVEIARTSVLSIHLLMCETDEYLGD